jgi:hypothetical protein
MKYFVGIQNSEVHKSIAFSPERPRVHRKRVDRHGGWDFAECYRRNSGNRVMEEEKPAKGEQIH